MRPKNTIEVILPQLSKYRGGVCVTYKVRNPQTGILDIHRIHKGFKDCVTPKEVTALSNKIIAEYTARLRGGWRPWADDNVIYSDQTMYNAESQIIGNTKRNGNQIKRRISEYIEEKRLTLSGKTMESYVSKLRIFVLWLEKTDRAATYLHKISPDTINEFAMFLINERKLDRLTVDKYKQNLSQFFRWLMDKNIVEKNPVLKMPLPPKTKDYAARPISDSDLDKLLREIKKTDPQLFLACMFEYFLCCRPAKN